ncbi:SOS response-associated peptidase family protein [Devosia soli]|nr:SOS response-associated peptidase family protein [Devosia soli]
MCGRFTAEYNWAELHALYSLSDELFPVATHNMQPRYNIAPTQDVDFVALARWSPLAAQSFEPLACPRRRLSFPVATID